MKLTNLLASLAAAVLLFSAAAAQAATIDTVHIGNPGNTGFGGSHGAVAYNYRIGTTEVTNAQYAEFLNAVAKTDAYGLYNTSMGSDTRGGITRSGASGSYSYAVKTPALSGAYVYNNKPVVYVSSGDAMRFANWLHNDQPTTGVQNAATTEDGAYTLNGATTNAALAAVVRNVSVARWWLPNEDEWFKAAYHKNDGVTGNYWDYPTGTFAMPNNNLPSSDTGNSANFYNEYTNVSTTGNLNYPLTDAGAYLDSSSPYGTFDQGGNVREWNETVYWNEFYSSLDRKIRGGSWDDYSTSLHYSTYLYVPPTFESNDTGFRVATIPEPGSVALCLTGVILLALRRGRK